MASAPASRAPEKARRTQEERSAATRGRLLDATLECLIEVGYTRTTTTLVAERAGLSRGAQVHHFPTKAELVIQAVLHLAARQAQAVRDTLADKPSAGDRLTQLLDLLWESFSGPLFYAALELWVAARTDPELHQSLYQLERHVGKAMSDLWRELGGDLASRAAFDDVLALSFHLMRGMALQRILRDDDSERRRLFETWKAMVSGAMAGERAASPGERNDPNPRRSRDERKEAIR
jgi:AcrR family transcriptional regulator